MPRASNKGLRPLVTLGLALREARRAAGVTQAELAERCDLNVNYVSLLERGERNPTASTLFAIAAALAVPPHEFFREDGSNRAFPFRLRRSGLAPIAHPDVIAADRGLLR